MTPPKGRGPADAKIMVVGEAYGKWEAQEGKPFVGPAGRVLEELLLKSGINPSSVYYTNIVNAQPPGNDLSSWYKHGIPNDLVADGISSLREEVEAVNPNVIVPVGNWPLYTFYGQKLNKDGVPTGILDYRGYVLEARKLSRGRKIIPTVHPSFILQGGSSHAPLAILDFKRIKAESAYPDIRRKPRKVYIDPVGVEWEALRARLLTEGKCIFVDIEGFGAKLLCIGFAVSSDWAVVVRINSASDLARCREIIESGRPLAAQNAMFDLGTFDWHHGIDVFKHLVFDTMVAAYNINIEDKKDLGHLGGLYTDLPAWWDVIDWNKIKSGQQSIDEVWHYNGLDCMSGYEIMEKQELELATDPKMVEAFQFDMMKLPVLWEMSKRGVLVDQDKVKSTLARAKADEQEAQAVLDDMYGKPLNVKSGPMIVEFLADLEVFLHKRTPPSTKFPKGQLKTDSPTLMEAMRKTESKTARAAIKLIVGCREARDLESKFGGIEWDDDGRARCTYDSTKTNTRRLSSKTFFPTNKGTNLQNQAAPGSSKYGTDVRSCYRADPGYEFGYSDLKGAEFLVVAELTQDPMMLKYAQMSIDGTGDVHRETAAFVFSIIRGIKLKPEDFAKDSVERFLGKKTRHSGNYMVGPNELMLRINAEALETGVFVTLKEIKQIISAYLVLHPGLPAWWKETEITLRQTGMLRNLFGFPRRFYGNVAQNLPAAVAFVPQSTIGDALNYGLVACHHDSELKFYGYQNLLNVHDAIGFQYPIENREPVTKRVRELMSIPITIPKTGKQLRIPVEMAVGPNWGELEVIK